MTKKTTFYVKFLSICLLLLTSCGSACTTTSFVGTGNKELFPRNSFVQVQQSVELEACGTDTITKKEKCQTAVMKYVSSGAYVFHSEVSQGTSYVLTAGHSCQNKMPKRQQVDGFKVVNKGATFKAVDLNGIYHDAEVVQINDRFDLCLMQVFDVYKNPPTLKIAEKEPKKGETVINMAAPHGLFWPGTVLIFKGQFSGYHQRGYSVYTIPTKPGSSGSPILNINNKLVGVIFAGYPRIESVGLSSPLIAIKIFLKKSVSLGEMILWEKTSKPKVKSQIDKVWIIEMKTKLDEVFGN
jgi:S1-C subfamily serine protease